jgi:hypothetical protein
MAILIQMPLAVCRGFIGRCPLDSREYEILKNSVISHVPEYLREGNVVELFCNAKDAELLLARAKSFYPAAASYIEEGIRVALANQITPEIEYRKLSGGDTWHFCPTCSQWPTEDFLSSKDLPKTALACNECVVKAKHGER